MRWTPAGLSMFLALGGCGASAAMRIELVPGKPVVLKQATPVDPVVSLSCPATVVVSQDGHVRGLIACPQQGAATLQVPLGALDSRSGHSISIGVRRNLLPPQFQSVLDGVCGECGPDYPCCPPN